MELKHHTILITGGSEGIGLSLAKRLLADNTVIICGRSREKLERAKHQCPGLITEVCDVTDEMQRRNMVGRLLRNHPKLNVLINNAGAKHRTDLLSGDGLETAMDADMALNFTAPASLCNELLPHLQQQPEAAIINMTTGLVHLPKTEQAFYCTAKAALHSYTQSLRWLLGEMNVAVFEVLLTLVNTNFHKGELPDNIPAIAPDEAARLTLRGIARNREEIYIGKAGLARWLALFAPKRGMAIING